MAFPKKVTIPTKTNAIPVTDITKQISAEEINQIAEAINENALFYGGGFTSLSALQNEHPNPSIGGWAYLSNGDKYEVKEVDTWTIATGASSSSITWKGSWASGNYQKNDAVEYQGSSYIVRVNTIGGALPTNTSYWDILAKKGQDGTGTGTGGIESVLTRYVATKTGASETFTLPDDINSGDVFFNGLRLDQETEYSQNGDVLTITPNGGISIGDIINVKQYGGSATGITYDIATQNWIDYNTTAGNYLVDDTKLGVLNDLIVGMKAANIWQVTDGMSYRAFNDTGMEDAATIDIKRLEPFIIEGGMAYNEKGFKGNGTDGFIKTNIKPSLNTTHYTLDNAGRMFLVSENHSLGNGEMMGADGALQTFYSLPDNKNQRMNSKKSGLNAAVDMDGLGLKGQFRDDNINVRLYNKNTEYIRTQPSSVEPITNEYYEFSKGEDYVRTFSDIGGAFSWWGASLTKSQFETMVTLLNNCLVGMGLTAFAS